MCILINQMKQLINTTIHINTYHRTTKLKLADDTKFKVGDHVTISKYKNIFVKGYVTNWSEEVFVFTKIKNTVPCTYVISDLKGEEIFGTLCEKELGKTNQKEFRMENVIKRKGDKLYAKWI